MKKIIFLLFVSFCGKIAAQNFDSEWKKVIQFEIDGKTTSANNEVLEIYKKAKKKNNEPQLLKCFFYLSKFEQVFNENAQSKILFDLRKKITVGSQENKALLNSVYANLLQNYLNINSNSINARTNLKNQKSDDFLTWTYADFTKEIDNAYSNSLRNSDVLHKVSLEKYGALFTNSYNGYSKKTTLFDYLFQTNIDYLQSKIKNWKLPNLNTNELFYLNAKEFSKTESKLIQDNYLKKIVELFKQNEAYYSNNKKEELNKQILYRYEFIRKINGYSQSYYSAIKNLEHNSSNSELLQQLKANRVSYWYTVSENNSAKFYKNALALTDTILKTNVNLDAMAQASAVKIAILSKNLVVNLKNTYYPKENIRAFVTYTNVDSIVVKYYKIPAQHEFEKFYNQYVEDTLLKSFMTKNQILKTVIKKLPNANDLNSHTTEILLEPVEEGNYLLFFEALNSNKTIVKTYQKITVTSLFPVVDSDKENDLIYVLNRKTGVPIDNVTLTRDSKNYKSDREGKIKIPKEKYNKETSKNYFSEKIMFSKDNDTLIDTYHKTYLKPENDGDEYDDYEAETMVFFDRAIYRPGQKVYYKAVMVQQKDGVKSVVPNLTVAVEVVDNFSKTIFETTLKTNEFGSINGEFDLPKNVLTGTLRLNISEPETIENDTQYFDAKEKVHQFWDHVEYNKIEFPFMVEEYKRPTFQITMNPIRENYSVGDVVTISGNAKTLAGSNLSNAKVAYDVFKHITMKGNTYSENENYIQNEMVTDENGNFKIQFTTKHPTIANDSITSIYFNTTIKITDTNGETKTTSQQMYVSQETLKLNLSSSRQINIDEKNNKLKIISTTLNNFPINSKGTIEFKYTKTKKYIKERTFHAPEINTLTRKEFEKLFPHEPYDQTDYEAKDTLVKIVNFDTEITDEVNLDFLQNYEPGTFKVKIKALDSKKNEIFDDNYLSTISKKNPNYHQQLFTVYKKEERNSSHFEFELQSKIKDLLIIVRTYCNNEMIQYSKVQLVDGKGKLSVQKNSTTEKTLTHHFFTVWDNTPFTHEIFSEKEELERILNIESTSYRNKIEPGSNETWSFKIRDNQLEAEVLASMYDMSLDQFKIKNWENVYFYNHYSNRVNFPEYKNTEIKTAKINTFYQFNRYQIPLKQKPKLNWFGFSFDKRYSKNYQTNYLNEMKIFLEDTTDAKMISGCVIDSYGPLPGATIIIVDSNRNTSTDVDGNFSILINKNETLKITLLGYLDEVITITDFKPLNIILEEASPILEEVIVGAIGIRKKMSAITYSSERVVEEITQAGNPNVVQALIGKVSGLQINTTNNSVNPTSKIVLKGSSSLNGSTSALIVIDGVIATPETLAKIAPEDIIDVSIIKGVEGTALYGSQGANGVVIVSTKKMLQDVAKVKTRTNFNETAFFYPNIKTDKDGKIVFSFTTPESLTKWKLRLFAHNKKAEVGYFQSEIVSQKDVMIMPNMPRFVREKDTITISAKVVNMTNEGKSGTAVLYLYDASTMKSIDAIVLNTNNTKNFLCKPKESVPVSWTITIPEGIQGLQYKIIAKSGNFTDGEENILPVLTNKILITESIPLWVREKTKKEVVFENLKNASSTLKNHLFTLEYTSNPVWIALQSLPYLMEYEHECSEQTFARYYANCIAKEIITSNPKVAEVFEKWKKQGVKSKLEMNEELKSVLIAETPWLLDADETFRNKQLATLMDLKTLDESTDLTFRKLEKKLLPTGGFPWFDGGKENSYISQHVLSGLGHLIKMFPNSEAKYENIVSKGIPNLDTRFLERNDSKNKKSFNYNPIDLHYLYARSFYLKKYPLAHNLDSIVSIQLTEVKKNWLQYSLYEKGMLALVLHRFKENEFAKKILTSLKESAAHNSESGMYWLENTNGYYWYQSAVETQALLIEAFSEIDYDTKTIYELKVWLIKNKQSSRWSTTKSTTEAIYALLLGGSDWTSIKDNTKFVIGNEKILSKKLSEKDKEASTGYIKMNWKAEEITKEMATVKITNNSEIPGYGGVYWQYFEDLENVKSSTKSNLMITKELYKKVKTNEGNKLVSLDDEKVELGDLITIRLILKADNDLEFVHLKDLRASCFEPIDVFSGYKWSPLNYYMSTKDVATHFFFDTVHKGTYVLEYDVRVNNLGTFNNGIATLQSMYAPEFSAHSASCKIKISE